MTVNNKIILREVKDYIFITLGLLLFTFGWTVFLLPNHIVTGGVAGVSAIIFYATGFKVENSYFFINVALLAVALRVLGLKFLTKTIYKQTNNPMKLFSKQIVGVLRLKCPERSKFSLRQIDIGERL